jgi:hypothetical protein
MPFASLRVVLGGLCIMFAFFFGRMILRMLRGQARQSTAISWTLRLVVTGAAVIWHAGFDRITIAVYALSLLAMGGGFYLEWRPKYRDELEKVMFRQD